MAAHWKQGRERLPAALTVVPYILVVLLTVNLWLTRGWSSSPQQQLTTTITSKPVHAADASLGTLQCQHVSKPIPPLKTRYDIARLCEEEGLHIGVELGVQNGNFAHQNLLNWPSCERYYMVDLWAPLEVRQATHSSCLQ